MRYIPPVLAGAVVLLIGCTAAQMQTVSAELQAGCQEYAAIAAPLSTAPEPLVASYLSYGSALCDVATGQVQTAALPNVDANTAAWIKAISGAIQAAQQAVPVPATPATKA